MIKKPNVGMRMSWLDMLRCFLPILSASLLIPLQYFFETGMPIFSWPVVATIGLFTIGSCLIIICLYGILRRKWVLQVALSSLIVLYVDIFIIKGQLERISGNIRLDLVLTSLCFILLILMFYFVCSKFNKIINSAVPVYFFIMVIMGFFTLGPSNFDFIRSGSDGRKVQINKMPAIIHIIFDELGSPKYMPKQMSNGIDYHEMMIKYLATHKYEYYPESYSRSAESIVSISSLINFDRSVTGIYSHSYGELWDVHESAYLKAISQLRYKMYLYETSAVNFCDAKGVKFIICDSTDYARKDWLYEAPISVPDKAKYLLVSLLQKSKIWSLSKRFYQKIQRDFLRGLPHTPEAVPLYNNPLSAFTIASKIKKRIDQMSSGDFLFAHLLIPHSPYLLDENCKMVANLDRLLLKVKNNSKTQITYKLTPKQFYEEFKQKYQEKDFRNFAQQYGCAISILKDFVNRINKNPKLKDALVIFHGDHGNRRIDTNVSQLKTFLAVRNGRVVGRDEGSSSLNRIFFNIINNLFPVKSNFAYRDTEILESIIVEGNLHSKEADFSAK
jgi:hypothetical protein